MIADAELVRRAASGDETAFALVWERHRDAVYRFAHWMLGRREFAEDVCQEAFLQLVRDPARYRAARGSLRSFLFGIARNLCRNVIRKQRPELDLDEDHPDADGCALDGLMAAQDSQALSAAIANLPPVQREALFLVEMEEMSLRDAAVLLDTDAETLKSRLYRALQNLRRQLAWMRT